MMCVRDDCCFFLFSTQPFVDFGMGSRNRPPEKKSVVIKNRTTAKMTVTWQIPDSYDGDDDRDWQVIPPVKEIGPGKSETFSVAFMPSADDFYYSQELEAYATFKVRVGVGAHEPCARRSCAVLFFKATRPTQRALWLSFCRATAPFDLWTTTRSFRLGACLSVCLATRSHPRHSSSPKLRAISRSLTPLASTCSCTSPRATWVNLCTKPSN